MVLVRNFKFRIQRVRILELEKAEKERRLQELIDEKYKMHYQWLHEQRSLENRIRQMEVDFQLLVGGKSSSLANISRLLCQSQVSAIDSPPYSSRGRSYGVCMGLILLKCKKRIGTYNFAEKINKFDRLRSEFYNLGNFRSVILQNISRLANCRMLMPHYCLTTF